jgi:hypothetical protein
VCWLKVYEPELTLLKYLLPIGEGPALVSMTGKSNNFPQGGTAVPEFA